MEVVKRNILLVLFPSWACISYQQQELEEKTLNAKLTNPVLMIKLSTLWINSK